MLGKIHNFNNGINSESNQRGKAQKDQLLASALNSKCNYYNTKKAKYFKARQNIVGV